MANDWRKFEEALVDAFRVNGFKPRRSTWLNSQGTDETGDWVVHIEAPDSGGDSLTIVETINVTNLAKRLAFTLA